MSSSPRVQSPPCGCRLLAGGIITLCLAPALGLAAFRDDVGFTALQAELGSATPSGAGVAVSQVEGDMEIGGQLTWVPDPTNGEFVGKTITQVYQAPAGVYSGHATAVGVGFYGLYSSTSPGITSIAAYWADRWAFEDFLIPNGTRRPLSSASRVVNHSWAGSASTAAGNAELLSRLDWVIESDDMLHVVAHLAPGGASALLSSGFNVIAIGRSADTVNTGSAAVDSIYVAGRARPDVVVPSDTPSMATAYASSMIALLAQTGHATAALSTDPVATSYTNRAGALIRNAERSEVIKAALLAGAARVTHNTAAADIGLYRSSAADRTGNGLDLRYGAGQINIRNSYRIIASGEQNSAQDGGPGAGAATRGFDFDPSFGGSGTANSTGTYALPVAAVPQLLTAALAWTLHIDGGTQNYFNGTATLRDLALSVVDVTNPVNPVTIATSQSTTENTENVWLVVPAGASYQLRVTRGSGPTFDYDYAIAWQLLPDTDADGAHDGQDNCTAAANGPILRDVGGNSQLDADGDGYGNYCDADLNASGMVTVTDFNILRSKLNTADAAGDLNGSGLVTVADYSVLQNSLNTPPGPSALAP